MVSSHQTRDLECFADSSNTPWNPSTIHCPDLTATIPQMSLLSLCAVLILKSHLFLICVALTCNDFRIIPHKTWQIPGNCQCKGLLVSMSAPRRLLGSFCFTWVALKPLSCQILYHHDISMIFTRITPFTENFCDLLLSSHQKFPLGRTTVPERLLQGALVICVFKQISQFGSFGKCV